MPRLTRWLYARLGRRYARLVIAAQLVGSYFVVAVGISALWLYEDMTWAEFGLLLVCEELLLTAENLFAYKVASRLLRRADPWLRGDRSGAAATDAWAALADLPSAWIRGFKGYPILLNGVPFCAFATWLLDVPWYAFFFLLAGGMVTLVFGLFLRFFVAELSLRPVLADVGRDLPEDAAPAHGGVTLRARLLIGLPMLNVITGSIVAGLSQTQRGEISELGVDVLIAVVVAFTLAFELTLLLSRSILAPLEDLRRALARVAEGDLDVRVPPTSTDELGRLAQSFNRMTDGLRERARLHEAFGAYVTPEVAERVLAEGPSLAGDEVEVTLMFLDIRDFTAYAERSSAREVVAELNAFFDLVVPLIGANGGQANKFMGDGLLAVFGAPVAVADHADRAVATACELCARVEERYGDRLQIGIGINSGTVMAGSIGGGGRVEFTVIGDAVNTAYRVEEATRGSGDVLLITEATRALLTRDFGEWVERPPAPLKGKREAVTLYARAKPSGAVAMIGSAWSEPLSPPRSAS